MPPARRILIVEDHDDTAESLAHWLELNGHSVERAHDRDVAMQQVSTNPPDVVISDYSMHGLGAAAFVRHCRAVCPQCKIAFISAAKGASEAARRLGVEVFFEKPFDPDEVAAFVA